MINFWKKKNPQYTTIKFFVGENGDIELKLFFTKDNIEQLIHLIYFLTQPSCVETVINVLSESVGKECANLIVQSINTYNKSLCKNTPIIHPGEVFSINE